MHLRVIDRLAENRYLEPACYLPVENLDVPMMFQGTKPRIHSEARACECKNNRRRQGNSVIGAASVPAEKPNRRPFERYQALERSKFLLPPVIL